MDCVGLDGVRDGRCDEAGLENSVAIHCGGVNVLVNFSSIELGVMEVADGEGDGIRC